MTTLCCDHSKTCAAAAAVAAAAVEETTPTKQFTSSGCSSSSSSSSSNGCCSSIQEKEKAAIMDCCSSNNKESCCCSSSKKKKTMEEATGDDGCCSSGKCTSNTAVVEKESSKQEPAVVVAAAATTGDGGGGCCSSGKCSSSHSHSASTGEKKEEASEDDDDDNDDDPICLAVVREDGADIVLFDAKGIPRTFWYPINNNNNDQEVVAGDIRRLCFSTHGMVGNGNDDLMTHCLDENGHHGTPSDEWCFCGVDTPHLHAHLHNPTTCGDEQETDTSNNQYKKKLSLEDRIQFLATHILHPKDDDNDEDDDGNNETIQEKEKKKATSRPSLKIAVSERMPKECNSENFSIPLEKNNNNDKKKKKIAKHKVRHDDHDDFLVHDKESVSLHLQHDCGNCGHVDVHGKFRSLTRRCWKKENKNQQKDDKHIQIHFFDIAPDRPFRLMDLHLDNLFNLDSDRVRAATPSTTTCFAASAEERIKANKTKTPPSSPHLIKNKMSSSPSECKDDDTAATDANEVSAATTAAAPMAVVVRSTFHCTRICCASEIPVIKRALAPVTGVDNILINVPLKQVIVDHYPNICTAQQIVQALNGYHLGAAVQRDGGATVVVVAAAGTSSDSNTVGRSQFYVSNICCPREIPMINSIVEPLVSVTKVSINVTTKMVYIDHNYQQLSANDILIALNDEAFGAELRVDAAAVATRNGGTISRSLFVTSQFTYTTTDNNNSDDDDANNSDDDDAGDGCAPDRGTSDIGVNVDELKTYLQAYHATQVECFVVDEPTKTITVIHNPNTLTATEICQGLATKTTIHAQILTDGGTSGRTGFDYDAVARLQHQDDGTDDAAAAAAAADFKRLTWPKPTVILSGVFWLISMLALIGGNWEYLKYVGLVSVAFGLPPIALKAFRTIKRIQFDTNCLMFFASVGALALGEFEEAAAVVFLFALSEWLEVRATTRARQALSVIVNLRPDKANLVHPETQELIVVPASIVPVGALVSVRTGDKIPCDGVVVEGATTVDESSLTGESRPIRKGPQDKVSGGTVNSGGTQLMVRTISTAENSAVSRLIRLVEEAQANRSETEQIVDEFAKIYTPVVVLAALLMCTIPWAFGKELGREWTNNGLVLIVVACPCALIISTPVSYVAGLATTAQKGILIKGGAYLESLGMVKHVCFDKTGTLTNGEFALLHLEEWVNSNADGDDDHISNTRSNRTEVLQYLALMESRAAHPVAQAILAGTRNEGVSIPSDMKLQKHTIINGEGVVGVINGLDIHVGNERMFERLGLLENVPRKILDSVASWKTLGGNIGFMSIEGRGIVCAYCAADAVRPEAAKVVAKLKQRGIQITMLTGDNDVAAQAIGKQLGLEGPEQIRAKLLPVEKLAYIERLGEDSHLGRSALFGVCAPSNIVLFCGDGVNDAPAIAAANVGVAMGAGAALAMETADVTLLDSNLEKLFYSMDMGRRVIRKIWENIIFSISVKFVVLGFALTGRTHLWAAIASDVGAMILVTLNSMMLMPVRRNGPPHQSAMKRNGDLEKGELGKDLSQSSGVAKGGGCAKGCCGESKPKQQSCTAESKQDSCGSRPKHKSDATNVAKGGGCTKGCCGDSKPKPQSCTMESKQDSVPKPESDATNTAKSGCCAKGCCGDSKPTQQAPCTTGNDKVSCCSGKDSTTEVRCCSVPKPGESSTAKVVESGSCAKGCCGDSKPAQQAPCTTRSDQVSCCDGKDSVSKISCCSVPKPDESDTAKVAESGSCAKGCCGDSKSTQQSPYNTGNKPASCCSGKDSTDKVGCGGRAGAQPGDNSSDFDF